MFRLVLDIYKAIKKSGKKIPDHHADAAYLAAQNRKANDELVKHFRELESHLDKLDELENSLHQDLEEAESDKAHDFIKGQLERLNDQRQRIIDQLSAAKYRESSENHSVVEAKK